MHMGGKVLKEGGSQWVNEFLWGKWLVLVRHNCVIPNICYNICVQLSAKKSEWQEQPSWSRDLKFGKWQRLCQCIVCHCSSGLIMGKIACHTEMSMVGNGCDGWQVGRERWRLFVTGKVATRAPWQYMAYHCGSIQHITVAMLFLFFLPIITLCVCRGTVSHHSVCRATVSQLPRPPWQYMAYHRARLFFPSIRRVFVLLRYRKLSTLSKSISSARSSYSNGELI